MFHNDESARAVQEYRRRTTMNDPDARKLFRALQQPLLQRHRVPLRQLIL